tara:strand:- start:391 stop:549 length:159 start_codon:yes stop_codon:yes gene_type:complete
MIFDSQLTWELTMPPDPERLNSMIWVKISNAILKKNAENFRSFYNPFLLMIG